MSNTINVGLLLCDEVNPDSRAEHGLYQDMFNLSFNAVDPGLVLHPIACYLGEFPASIDDYDAYLISGSRYSVYDSEPWIQQLAAWVRSCWRQQKTTVGICYGHQMMAHALGGKAAKSENGWGVGVHSSRIVSDAKWLLPSISDYDLLVIHQDQVIEMPDGFRRLATSPFCENSMMSDGSSFLGIQGHPEFNPIYCTYRIKARVQQIPAKVYREGLASLQRQPDSAVVINWISRFIRL